MADEPYRLVDVDNHYYEPDDCFTRHLDPAFVDRAFHIERGAKGIGESGTIGSTPCIVNAVVDALSHLGVRHIDMPTTPQRVWEAIRAAAR